jgi:hypothetical protein
MNHLVKSIKHIQINKIASTPQLFNAIITYEIHPTEHDESDEIEAQKHLIHKLIKDNWFDKVDFKQ